MQYKQVLLFTISSLLPVMPLYYYFKTAFQPAEMSAAQIDALQLTEKLYYSARSPKHYKEWVDSDCYYFPQLYSGFLAFKEALAFKESSGNYFVVNHLGYLGKYQFNINTLAMVGVNEKDEFLNSPKIQERAFLAYTSRNKWILRREIKSFTGKTINGIQVTESGILAAAHLAGAGNVKKFLRSYGAIGFSDANGTTISYYLNKFSGYDTSFIKADKAAIVKLL